MLEEGTRTQRGSPVKGPPSSRVRDLTIIQTIAKNGSIVKELFTATKFMALHKDFPKDPYAILDPSIRWFPADEDLREKGAIQKLLPPLVAGLREKVKEWREDRKSVV